MIQYLFILFNCLLNKLSRELKLDKEVAFELSQKKGGKSSDGGATCALDSFIQLFGF